MGVDLIICKNDGEYVADIGRAHNYIDYNGELDINYDNLESYKNHLIDSFLNRVSNILFYEKGKESGVEGSFGETASEVDDIIDFLNEDLHDIAEELENVGSKKLLAYILEEDDLTYKMDY